MGLAAAVFAVHVRNAKGCRKEQLAMFYLGKEQGVQPRALKSSHQPSTTEPRYQCPPSQSNQNEIIDLDKAARRFRQRQIPGIFTTTSSHRGDASVYNTVPLTRPLQCQAKEKEDPAPAVEEARHGVSGIY